MQTDADTPDRPLNPLQLTEADGVQREVDAILNLLLVRGRRVRALRAAKADSNNNLNSDDISQPNGTQLRESVD